MVQKINNVKIEKRALNALESVIDKDPRLDHSFNQDDKAMSWDGFIKVDKTGDFSKKSFVSKVPVQIKGHYDPEHKYAKKQYIIRSVEIDDLNAYSTEKGVIYFQVFINDLQDTIFYASLYPSRLLDYLDKAKKNDSKKSTNVTFIRLDNNCDSLYKCVRQFDIESRRQGSAFTPTVADRIRLEDVDKIRQIQFEVPGEFDPFYIVNGLASGDICLYGKLEGDKYGRPVEWNKDARFIIGKDSQNDVCINDEVFYREYKCITDSRGEFCLKLSPNLTMSFTKGEIDFKPRSTLREVYHDAVFLLTLQNTYSFSIDTMLFKYINPTLSEDFNKRLEYVKDLYEIVCMIGMDPDMNVKEITEGQLNDLSKLVNLRRGCMNDKLAEGINRYLWKYGDDFYPLLIIKTGNEIELADAVYTNKYKIVLPYVDENNNNRECVLPNFVYQDIEALSRLYKYDYDDMFSQIDMIDVNKYTCDVVNECALLMIDVYDLSGKIEFLNLAERMIDRIFESERLDDLESEARYTLNSIQIHKRRDGYLGEKDLDILRQMPTINNVIEFGRCVLLGDSAGAESHFAQLSDKMKMEIRELPIYREFLK